MAPLAEEQQIAGDAAVFAENVRFVRARAAGPVEGVFGPASATWWFFRESALLLGGLRALLLQVAHPAVAAAVAGHSDFRKDPFRRAYRTFDMVYRIVFGDLHSAIEMAERIHLRHHGVRGVLSDHDARRRGASSVGTAYRANDPALLLWVHATLLDTAIRTFELVVRPLTGDERVRIHDESRLAAALFGIPEDAFWPTVGAFDAWFARTVDEELAIGATARELGRSLLEPRAVMRVVSELARRLTPGLLPPRLREGYGLRFGDDEQRSHLRLAGLLRHGCARLPATLRYVPGYHQALARLAEAEGRRPPVEARLIRLVKRAVSLPLSL